MKSKCFFKVLIPHLAILTVLLMSGSALAQAPILCELDPISQTRCEGFTAAFTVTASGGVPPYTYSWSGPACPCTGPTLDSIRIPSVSLADAGIYTVVITDAAGNQTTCSGQLIVNENPVCDITGGGDAACPNETIQYCAPAGMDEYIWNIIGNGTIIGPTNQQCVTVTAGEQCGQSFTLFQSVTDNLCILRCDRTVTIDDVDPPVCTPPGPITVECEEDVPAPDVSLLSCEDNCDPNPTKTWISDSPLSGGPCGGTITRTYRCEDACGNFSECTQLITVEDTTPPAVTCPGDFTVQCVADIPECEPANATATDNCSDVTVTCSQGPLVGDQCPATVTVTYTATDACGNSASCTQVITVDDSEDPTIVCPNGMTVQCEEDIPAAATTVAGFIALGGQVGDNCDGNLVLSSTDGDLTNGACGGTVTRTYTVTDDCGNTASCDHVFTVNDTENPVISCPDGITVQCEDDIPDGVTTIATFVQLGGEVSDNCDVTLSLSFSDAPLSGAPCGGTIARTYTVTDDCGNTASCDQIITVNDTIAPVITDVGGPQTIECPAEPQFSEPTVMDNCDDAPEFSFTDEIVEEGDCGAYVVTRTWTAVDACGNEAESRSQTITVECPCPADEFCTFTQGYYGNEGGFKNGESTIEILDRLIPIGDPLVIGMPGRSVTFYDGSEMCILELLPGGGPSSALPDDGDIEINATEDCSELGGGNGGRGGKGGGGLRNSLFNQTLTLSLNVRYSDSLEYVELCNVWVIQDANCGPNGFCGDDDDFPEGETSEWYFSDELLQALADEGLPQTVGGLLELANRGLAGLSTGSLRLSAISEAVDRINNAFDDCKFLIECHDGPADMLGMTNLPKSNTVPAEFELNQNHPNPFNPSTTISYALPEGGQVDLGIFNVLGQQVATVVSGIQPAGNHQVVWDGRDQSGRAMSTGMYFYRLKVGNEVETRKMLLLK